MRPLTADAIIGYLTGETLLVKNTGSRHSPSHEEVARLAFHFYERRGRREDSDVDDWLRAESELRRHRS